MSVPKSVNLDEEESQSLPPPTYPPLKPPSPSTQLTPIQQQSPQEHYVRISTATARTLPKGEHISISFVLSLHSQ